LLTSDENIKPSNKLDNKIDLIPKNINDKIVDSDSDDDSDKKTSLNNKCSNSKNKGQDNHNYSKSLLKFLNKETQDVKSSRDEWQKNIDKGKGRKRRDKSEDEIKYKDNMFDDHEINKNKLGWALKRSRETSEKNVVRVYDNKRDKFIDMSKDDYKTKDE